MKRCSWASIAGLGFTPPQNLILNYKFFYSQIYLIFYFVDGNLFNFFIKVLNSFFIFIKALNSFLFARLLEKYIFSKLILAQLL